MIEKTTSEVKRFSATRKVAGFFGKSYRLITARALHRAGIGGMKGIFVK